MRENCLQMTIYPTHNCKWSWYILKKFHNVVYLFFWIVCSFFKILKLYIVQDLHTNFCHVWNLKYCFLKVVFGNLDLIFKLIDLKCLDLKFIDLKSYFRSMHFKHLKSLTDLLNPNPWLFLNFSNKIFGF